MNPHMSEELLASAKNAAAMLGAIYQWLDRVNDAGGVASISGVSACHAMLKSLQGNRARAEKMIMEPLRQAIENAEAGQ